MTFCRDLCQVLFLAVFIAVTARGLREDEDCIETRPLVESNEKIKVG